MTAARFFSTPAAFRDWLRGHHDKEPELVVGYWKKATGKPSLTWEESVDEALCYGWIDGVRRRIDDEAFSVRFTPRRVDSIWSRRNLGRIELLRAEGRMKPPGLEAWRRRRENPSGVYAFESMAADFTPKEQAMFGEAWSFFAKQPPGHRKAVLHWVHAAKKEETRARRLDAVVQASRKGIRVNLGQPFAHLN